MNGSDMKLFCIVLALSVITGCAHTKIEDFSFIDINGSAVLLKEAPSFPPGKEGRLNLQDDIFTTPRYSINSPIEKETGNSGLFIKYSGNISGRILIYYESGNDEYAIPEGNCGSVEAVFPLRRNEPINGFKIEADGDYEDWRIQGTGIRDYRPAVSFTHDNPVISNGFELYKSDDRTEITVLPGLEPEYIYVDYTYDENNGKPEQKPNIKITDSHGSTLFIIDPLFGNHEIIIPVFHNDGPVTVMDHGLINEVGITENERKYIDLGYLLDPEIEITGSFQYYRWNDFPNIIIFDTADYAVQSGLFKRIAFFVEKYGYAGRVLDEDALEGLHGWNAHDYRAEDLAEFFSEADRSGIVLNHLEQELRTILMHEGIITSDNSGYIAVTGGIMSVSKESTMYLRELFLAHEGYHGIFFSDPEFEKYVLDLYSGLDPGFKDFWKLFLGWKGYDVNNTYLMANELQAYFLQQPVQRIDGYFKEYNIPKMLEIFPEHEALLMKLQSEDNSIFYETALTLHEFIKNRTGYGSGNLFSLRIPDTEG